MSPKPIKRVSLTSQLCDEMERMIARGEWALGQRIPPLSELAESFAVSPNTLREALQGLIHAGILRARPGDGTYVMATNRFEAALNQAFSEAGIEGILQARLAIEKSIVELAAAQCNSQDIADLHQALNKCKTRSGEGISADLAFHCRVADCARNPIMSQFYRVLAGHLGHELASTLEHRQYEPEAIDLHHQLIDALEARDATTARLIIEKIVAFDYHALVP